MLACEEQYDIMLPFFTARYEQAYINVMSFIIAYIILRQVDTGIVHTHPPFTFVFTSAREMIEFIVILVKNFIITLEINSEDVNTIPGSTTRIMNL
jgi:hypothetical protein